MEQLLVEFVSTREVFPNDWGTWTEAQDMGECKHEPTVPWTRAASMEGAEGGTRPCS